MAGLAGFISGVVLHIDLGERGRSPGDDCVAACAQHFRVGKRRFHRSGIQHVVLRGTVAALAVEGGVFACLLQLNDVRMTVFAGVSGGVDNGFAGDFGERIAPIMSVLPETLRNELRSDEEE